MPYEGDEKKQVLRELNTLAREYGISPDNCHAMSGGPAFDEICRLAQAIPADLIVLPTHGYTGLKHMFLGSTAERVVQHAHCPVFIVRQSGKRSAQENPDYKKILVPVDFSPCSQKGLQYAIGFANELRGEITLLYATYLGYVYSCVGTALYDIPGLQEAASKNAKRQMRRLVRGTKFGRVKFETVFTEGSPVLDICDFAKNHDVDLIITSTHGLTGFEHVLIGSIAEKVVRHAPCSVLVVASHPQIRAATLAKISRRGTRTLEGELQPRKSPRSKSARYLPGACAPIVTAS
jgi:nucleotide-binding universal stress UspA family protein